jgi:hypothetical protein
MPLEREHRHSKEESSPSSATVPPRLSQRRLGCLDTTIMQRSSEPSESATDWGCRAAIRAEVHIGDYPKAASHHR